MGLPDAPQATPWCGWAAVISLPAAVLILTPADWPRWAFMGLLAWAIFVGCKWLTWRRTPAPQAPWRLHAGYLLAWPGMDAAAFLSGQPRSSKTRPTPLEWADAASRLLLGIVLFWGAGRLIPPDQEILLGWAGMVGMILILHFGSFQLLSCAWRAVGVDARPLMTHPLASTSVSEFWGRRWNAAFRDLTYRFVFRPLTGLLGPRWAIAVGFAFSGLVHDLVISVPAAGGYGGLSVFFLIQAAALLTERSRPGRRLGLGHGWRGWSFTMLALALPAPLLFHPPFLHQVVVPLMKALGAA